MKSRKQQLVEKEWEYLAEAFRQLSNIVETPREPNAVITSAKAFLRQTTLGYIKLHEDFKREAE